VSSLGSRSDILSLHGTCDPRKLKNLTESSQKSRILIILKSAWTFRLNSEIFVEILGLLYVLVSVSCMLFVNAFAEVITNKLNFIFVLCNGIASRYGLDCLGFETSCWPGFPYPSGSALMPTQSSVE